MSQATTESRAGREREPSAALPASHRWRGLIYALFFLSGLTSLIYEVIWVRRFGEVFGVTTYATSTVLAAFFTGLAVGSYVAGRVIDRGKLHPLVVYGAMEGVIGLYALLLPVLLWLVELTYPAVYAHVAGSFSLFTLFRFLASFAVLLIPTTLMGATLPVLSKLMVGREGELGVNVGRLYAINTFGAVAGSIGAGYYLVKLFGVPTTIHLAAYANFLLAVIAILMSQTAAFRGVQVRKAEERERRPRSADDRLVLGLAFTCGFTILALEVVWTRSLVLILGWTTYAFAAMLTSVLVGIAVGSALFASAADRRENRGALAAGVIVLAGGFALLGPTVVNNLPFIFVKLREWTGGAFSLLNVVQLIVCFLLVFVPTLLSGAVFPVLVRMHAQGESHVGRTVADVYAVNTFGGIFGSLLAGFVFIRLFGTSGTITLMALLLTGVGGVLALALARPWRRELRTGLSLALGAGVLLLAAFHPRFDTKLLTAGWGPFAGTTLDLSSHYATRVRYHREGVSAIVDVGDNGYGMRFMSINAQPVATTYLLDLRALQMLGHLPVLLHPDPKQVLIIGLGAGVSSGTIATYPGVEQVTVVELNEEVPGGAAEFKDWNFDVLNNPKVKIIINDGANFVKATREHYDFISADPIHPFIAGNGILYSADHWKVCRERLNEGGVIAQWIPLYQLSPTDWATIVHTFTSVFPNSSMWYSGIDVVLVGFKGDVKVDLDRMAAKMSDPRIAQDLLTMGVHSPGDVFGWFIAGPDQLQEMGAGAPINTVDRPILEYTAPRALQIDGTNSTMPALLTALDRLSLSNPGRQMSALCTRPLTRQELFAAAENQVANKWLMRAMILDTNGKPDQYLQAMEQARALRPNDQFVAQALAEAQTRQGDSLYNAGDLTGALQLYQQAFINDPSCVTAASDAVQCALERRDLPLAHVLLEEVPPAYQEEMNVLVARGLLALSERDYDAARAAFRKVEGFGQECPDMHMGLGLVALKEGAREEAYRHFDRAVEEAARPMQALYRIVSYCLFHGMQSDVHSYAADLVASATSAIAANPTDPMLYDKRALAYEILGEEELEQRDRATAASLSDWWPR